MRTRPGIALVVTLTVLLLVEVMTACMLALATQTRMVAASDVRTARADGSAQLALETVLASASGNRWDTLAPGSRIVAATGEAADAVWSASVERLQSGLFVIEANSRVGGAAAFSTGRAAAIARMLDKAAVLEEFNTALAAAGITIIAGATQIRADAARLPEAWVDSVCPTVDPLPEPAALTTARPAMVGDAATISGPVTLDSLLAVPDSVALGGVSWRDLDHIADRIESGSVSPAAVHDETSCNFTAAGNWGDPLHQESPCASYFPLIVAHGDLRVQGGAGQGILVVTGTLTVSAGATFVGVIVARGGLILEPGSTAFGSIRSEGDVTLVDDSSLTYSRCAIARVLAGTAAARRLILQQRTFIPAF